MRRQRNGRADYDPPIVSDLADRIARGHPAGYFVLGDALRGLASIVVVINHGTLGAALYFGGTYAGDPAHAFGAFSFVTVRFGSPLIYMFFALSGYLVGGPWVRSWLGDRPRPRIPRYFERRARRLLPAFWLIITVRLLDQGTYGLDDKHVVGTYLALQTFYGGTQQALVSQGWTVNIEVFFYLCLPLLFVVAARLPGLARGSRDTRRRALVAFLVTWSAAGLATRMNTAPDGPLGHSVLTLGWAFSPGMIAAAYERELRIWLPQQSFGQVLGVTLVAVAILSDGLVVAFQIDDGRVAAELLHFTCGTGFLVGSLLYEWSGGVVPRILDSRAVHALGRWSYGVYLIHLTVGQFLLRHAPDDFGPNKLLAYLLVGMLSITIALAAAMWRFWEEPWLEGFLPWRRPPKPEAAAIAR